MTRESLIFLLGIIVLLTPFLGIPGEWKHYITIGAGVLIVIVGYQLRRAAYLRSIESHNGERHTDVFVESGEPETAEEEKHI